MSLTPDEIQHIASLARVGLTADELEQYRSQMEVILDNFQVLQEADTEDVPPMGHSVPLENVFREDEPSNSLDKEETLANAPRREDDYFRVRVVLE